MITSNKPATAVGPRLFYSLRLLEPQCFSVTGWFPSRPIIWLHGLGCSDGRSRALLNSGCTYPQFHGRPLGSLGGWSVPELTSTLAGLPSNVRPCVFCS